LAEKHYMSGIANGLLEPLMERVELLGGPRKKHPRWRPTRDSLRKGKIDETMEQATCFIDL